MEGGFKSHRHVILMKISVFNGFVPRSGIVKRCVSVVFPCLDNIYTQQKKTAHFGIRVISIILQQLREFQTEIHHCLYLKRLGVAK